MARLSREQRRAQLVALGVEAVADSSFDEVSLDDISARAGIARSLLFHYFPTRTDFLVAVAETAAAELLAVTEPDPRLALPERLRASLDAYVDFVSHRRGAYLSLVRGAAGGNTAMQQVFEQTRRAVAERFLIAFGASVEDAPPGLRIAARGAVGFIEEATVAWLDAGDTDQDTFVDLVQRAVERAVLDLVDDLV